MFVLFITVVFFVVAIAVVGGIVFLLVKKSAHMKKNGIPATGTVVGYEERDGLNNDDRTHYYPIVSFKTKEGADIQAPLSAGSTSRPYAIGSTLGIVYDPLNPKFVIKG